MRISLRLLFGGWLALSVACPVAQAADWLQFRGSLNAGVADEKVPSEWNSDKNIAWKTRIPGVAWSSPIVVGDKVIITTAVTENQRKPVGFGGGGGGRGPGGGGPGGGGPPAPPEPGQILAPFIQNIFNLNDEQKGQVAKLQTEVNDGLAALLTAEQEKKLKEPAEDGPGRFGGMALPGQILSNANQERLTLTDDQKAKLATLQANVDQQLAKVFSAEQNNQLKEWKDRFAGGPGGGRGPGGPGGPGGRRGGFGGPGGNGPSPPNDVYRWEVHCLDRATGKILWSQLALEGKPRIPTQESNTYATETPVSDGERIYAYFGMHGIYCYDLQGKLLWKKDLGSYPMMAGWGTASSPVLEGNRVFVLCDNEEKSFLVALDKMTGDELWRVDRTDQRTNWSTPIVWRNKVRTELVTLGSPKMRSYDPATGKQLWELTLGEGQCSASPTASPDVLVAGLRGRGGRGPGGGGPGGGGPGGGGPGGGGPGGGGPGGGGPGGGDGSPRGGIRIGGLFAVAAGAEGNLSDENGAPASDKVLWTTDRGAPEMASPLIYDGYVYTVSQNGGIMTCVDAKTGEEKYRQRLPGAKAFWSSPWATDGKIFCLDDGGTTFVVQAGPEFKVLAQNELNEMFWSSPAIADGAVFLRSVDHLYCVAEQAAKK